MNKNLIITVLLLGALSLALVGCGANPTGNVVATPTAQQQDNSKESLEIKGSDTLLQLVANMAETYGKNHEGHITVTGGGSGTGIAAVLNGEADVADSSRAIKQKEIDKAQELGYTPVEVIVGRDMLSVITHPDNPIEVLTKDQIGAIFKGEITNWKDVGGEDEEITLYGRQSTSGTYAFFMEFVLEADYSPKMRNMEGNSAILEAVRQDPTGIGYVGLGYVKDKEGNQVEGITVLSVKENEGSTAINPLNKATLGNYPIGRPLFQYLKEKPAPGSLLESFIQFELSDAGQAIVEETGFVTITEADKAANNAVLG